MLLQFDRNAQLGWVQVRDLAAAAVHEVLLQQQAGASSASAAASSPSSTNDSTAFASLDALRSGMASLRAGELAKLNDWFAADSSAAGAMALFSRPEDVEASEGAMERLLLAASGVVESEGAEEDQAASTNTPVGNGGRFSSALASLRHVQGEGRTFAGLFELATAARAAYADLVSRKKALLAWLGPSGLLDPATAGRLPLEAGSDAGRKFIAWIEMEGPIRARNELVASQQLQVQQEQTSVALAEAGDASAASTAAAAPGSVTFASVEQLLHSLSQRRLEALQSTPPAPL